MEGHHDKSLYYAKYPIIECKCLKVAIPVASQNFLQIFESTILWHLIWLQEDGDNIWELLSGMIGSTACESGMFGQPQFY